MRLHMCNSVANNCGVWRQQDTNTMLLFFISLLSMFVSVSTQSTIKIDTDFLTINSPSTLQAIEEHIFSPKVKKDIQKIFTSHVEHDGSKHSFPSYRYTVNGFWRNWKRMIQSGIPTGSANVGSGGKAGANFVVFAGDDKIRNYNITLSRTHKSTRQIQISGYEYGLANMAVFLSQTMVDGINDDTCEEYNEQSTKNDKGVTIWPLSNACGQYDTSYQDLVCPAAEKNMECPVSATMSIEALSSNTDITAFKCGPTSLYPPAKKNTNDLNRKDVEGCCWWGRGPLHTKGVCNLGKVNYYIGKRALDEGRINYSTKGTFPSIDFCFAPGAICEEHNEDLLWSIAMFEWAERIQRYSTAEWDYKKQLVQFVNGGMNMFEYYPDRINIDRDHAFIHAVSSIVDRGCHIPSDCSPYPGPVNKLVQRRLAFGLALSALNIPKMRSELVVEQVLDHLKSKRKGIEDNLLMYKRGKDIFTSQRYKFDDFYNAIYRFSKPYDASNTAYLTNITYFKSPDHDPLYMGGQYMRSGHKYGLANIALFFAVGLDLSIEKDDTCDELNEHENAGKLAISNSCGQRGLSYQNMACTSNPDMACPVDTNMYISAVTSNRQIGAPPPLVCGPISRFPSTGFWNFDEIAVSDDVAYANENGRIDVEGCCWWGRGIIQTRGTCSFGKLNYYIGKRASDEGRQSLFPDVDFCQNPEAICGSQYSRELIWMSGLFEWIDRVQSYNQGGFNYMTELHKFADSGMKDDVFITKVGSIVQSGCHNPPCQSAGCLEYPCDGAYPVNENAVVIKAFRTFSQLNLWNEFEETLGGSHKPSPAPTVCKRTNCTDIPTYSPVRETKRPTNKPIIVKTRQPTPQPTGEFDIRRRKFDELSRYLKQRKRAIESTVFVSKSRSGFGNVRSRLYTLDGFLATLKDLVVTGVEDMFFDIGQMAEGSSDQGLVNIALFLSHAMTRGIIYDTCEEVNDHLIDGKLPLSNACGQHGRSYSNDVCPLTDSKMECSVDLSMRVESKSIGNSLSKPFFCAPLKTHPFTGYFDPSQNRVVSSASFANDIGRTDVSGCCYWGRGILLSSGICDIGRFNYLFGLAAVMEGRSGRYNIDFCSNPEALCSDFTIPASDINRFPITIDTSASRYLIGQIYWMDHVQNFNWGYWNYKEKLKLFVEGGMSDDTFVDDFSEIVIESTRDAEERKSNFKKVLEVLFKEVLTDEPTQRPTNRPSTKPSIRPTVKSWNIDGTEAGSTLSTTTGGTSQGSNVAPPSGIINIGNVGPIDNFDSSNNGGSSSSSSGQWAVQGSTGVPPPSQSVGQNPAFAPNFGNTSPGTLQLPKQPSPPPTSPPNKPTNPGSVSLDLSIPVGGFPSTYVVGGNELTSGTNSASRSMKTTAALGFMYLVLIYHVFIL